VDYTNERVILVVEDNKDLLSFLSELLSQEYKIIKAENGRKAIKHALNEQQVDFIISDIMMPKMDGIELSDSKLSKADLCEELGMSQTQFRTQNTFFCLRSIPKTGVAISLSKHFLYFSSTFETMNLIVER
jgi:CheY-like chemotaxis protein